MKTIDERLESAALEVQRAVTQVPARPAEGVLQGNRVARAARAVAVLALVGAVIGGTAWLMGGTGDDAAAGSGDTVTEAEEDHRRLEAERVAAAAAARAEAEAAAQAEREAAAAAAAAAANDAVTAPIFGTETFTGEGPIASDVAVELKVAGRSVLEWGGAAGQPWALVTYEVAGDPVGQKPAMACITILPLVGENYCASPPGDLNDHMYAIGYSIGGDGGVVFVHAIAGATEVRVETAEQTWSVAVHGEAGGFPPSAVIPTPSHRFVGTLTAFDAAGNQLGDPVELAFTDSDFFPETPLGG